MDDLRGLNRRSVLKTIGAGVAGGAALTGTATAHGGGGQDLRLPSWFENQLWEMAEVPPHGPEPTDDHSHAPIWQIAPDAGDEGCAQIPGIIDFGPLADGDTLADDGSWEADYADLDDDGELEVVPGSGVYMDHTLSANPFSTLWHVHFVFDFQASSPYRPSDLVNQGVGGDALTSGARIKAAAEANLVTIEHVPFVFNCPIRPNQGDHYFRNLCQ